MTDANDLSDTQAVDALNYLAEQWLDHRGRQAYAVMQHTYASAQRQAMPLPTWASAGPSADPVVADAARRALDQVRNGDDAEASEWAEAAIIRVTGAGARMIDPISMTIGGLTLIGFVLAARIARVDRQGEKIEFYEGMPDLAGLLREAAGFLKG
ncbi:MAG: hypothetical protein V3V97_01470 [Hyphomicrobiaceae bacterium]